MFEVDFQVNMKEEMEDNSSSTFVDVELTGIEFGLATDNKLVLCDVERVIVDEDNDNANEAHGGGGQRMIWTEADDLRLVRAWLNNSIDSTQGNSKKSEMYWKNVLNEYNENNSTSVKLKIKQLKDHWSKTNKKVKYFHGAWSRVKEIYCSGQSDDQLMTYDQLVTKAENLYKDEMGHAFSFKYWWDVVKNQPKWIRMYNDPGKSKRMKLSESGSYASFQDREGKDIEFNEEIRPQGQKAVNVTRIIEKDKIQMSVEEMSTFDDTQTPIRPQGQKAINATRKIGKEKIQMSLEEMPTFGDTQTPKTEWFEKLAVLQHQTSENKLKVTEKKVKLELYDRYEKLQSVDVSTLTDLQKEQHRKKMLFLEKELFGV